MKKSIEWLEQEMYNTLKLYKSDWYVLDKLFEKAKKLQKTEQETLYTEQQVREEIKEQVREELIGFQIFLNNKGLITNHDWDYEALAKKYIKSLKKSKK